MNRVVKQNISHEKVTAEEIADMLTSKLGEGYKVEFKPKANVGKQMIVGGMKHDSVLIIKNAYHRMRVHVEEWNVPGTTEQKEYHFLFMILSSITSKMNILLK